MPQTEFPPNPSRAPRLSTRDAATALASAVLAICLWSWVSPLANAQPGRAAQRPEEIEPIYEEPIEPRRIVDIEVQMATAPDLPTYLYRLWSDGTIEMSSSDYPPEQFSAWKRLPEE